MTDSQAWVVGVGVPVGTEWLVTVPVFVFVLFIAHIPLYFCVKWAVTAAMRDHQRWLERRAAKREAATAAVGFPVITAAPAAEAPRPVPPAAGRSPLPAARPATVVGPQPRPAASAEPPANRARPAK